MPWSRTPRGAATLAAALALAACGAPRQPAASSPAPAQAPGAHGTSATPPNPAAVAEARADSARYPYTAADVHFMTAMIGHHAQAIQMARLAPTHGASPSIRTLAGRIVNAQRDEIATMQTWLRDRLQPVPEVSDSGTVSMPGGPRDADAHAAAAHHAAAHAGPAHAAMPGMLTAEQMRALDAARDEEFDRLFLVSMIQHHRGAVEMVKELFGTYGAGQNESVFRLATDINVDQITEIARMEQMLLELVLGDGAGAP
ncbi:MAG TPA: DUF305 domain-containing protein [Gemmatimonadaceae bacterium]